eukprot:5808489-Pyramimonas_sp.AAC.1
MAQQTVPTTAVATMPTRAIFFGSLAAQPPQCEGMKLLPGIPHHGLVRYRIQVPLWTRAMVRLHHTADYVLQRVPPEEE